MKNKLLLLLLTTFVFSQCRTIIDDIPDIEPNTTSEYCQESEDDCALVWANNSFGLDLFKNIYAAERSKNIFISPTSISTALTMALNGAKGGTYTEMHNMLKYDNLTLDQVNHSYQSILNLLPNLDPNVNMDIANSIWYDQGFSVKNDFLSVNSEFLNSEVIDLDFKDPASVGVINGWVNEKTHEKIPTILDQISSDAVMFLINAIYFKGDWRFTFPEELTQEAPFYPTSGNAVDVDMMTFDGKVTLPYFSNDLFQAVDLPYGDSIYSMSVILPNDGVEMDAVVDYLTPDHWDALAGDYEDTEIIFSMPKLKIKYDKMLNQNLQELGMQKAFTGNADFSKLSDIGVYISFVKHKSFLEINEVGTEAAAVTIIGIETTSVGPPSPLVRLNKPYLLAIRENKTNSLFFIGYIYNPNE